MADLHFTFSGIFGLVALAVGALYAGLVLMSYLSDARHLRPPVDRHDLGHSAERLAVWLGVKVLALAARVTAPVFMMLSEASADVGDWFLRQHSNRS